MPTLPPEPDSASPSNPKGAGNDRPNAQQALVEELGTLRNAWMRLALTLHDIHFETELASRPAPLQESQEVIAQVKK